MIIALTFSGFALRSMLEVEKTKSDKTTQRIAKYIARIVQDGDTILFASGRYLDRIVLAGEQGAPQYEERVVVCDSRRFDTQLAIPL